MTAFVLFRLIISHEKFAKIRKNVSKLGLFLRNKKCRLKILGLRIDLFNLNKMFKLQNMQWNYNYTNVLNTSNKKIC